MSVRLSATTYLETGAFETKPTGGLKANGFNMSWHGATGVLYPAELAYLPGHKAGELPGEYKVGAYYDGSHVADIATAHQLDSGRWGYDVLASQMVWRELQGTFPGRDRDNLNIGFVRAAVNPRLIAVKSAPRLSLAPGEQVAELSYGVGISPTVIIRPDVQYVMNPGAFTQQKYANAWAYGLQIKASF